MKRILGHIVSLLAVGFVAGAVMPACATNDQSIFIHGALAPSANRTNGACVYTGDPQQAMLLQAGLDVGVTDSYFAVLLVGNQLITRGDPQNNRAESNRAHINGGIVRVTEPDGRAIPGIPDFTSLATGFNDPQQNNAPGYSSIGLVVVDAPTADVLRASLPNRAVSRTVLINVKVFGKTLSGVDLESGEYQLPMQVCNGCLVSFAGGLDPAGPKDAQGNVIPNCNKPLVTGTSTSVPCRTGQDEIVPCQLCVGVKKACDPKNP